MRAMGVTGPVGMRTRVQRVRSLPPRHRGHRFEVTVQVAAGAVLGRTVVVDRGVERVATLAAAGRGLLA